MKRRSKKYFYLRSLSINRKSRRYKRIHKDLKSRRRKKTREISHHKKKSEYQGISEKFISVGKSFSLSDNPLNIIRIINEIEGCKRHTARLNVTIILDDVKKIDHAAICLLLSKVHQMAAFPNIFIQGTFPRDKECLGVFYESGFIDYMRDLSGRKFEKRGENLMIRIGSDKTDNERVGKLIKNSMKFLTGTERHYPPVFSLVQEMCANSIEHSSDGSPNWLFGVFHNIDKKTKEKYVTFTMTDMGFGILKTLNRKFHMIIREHMGSKSDADILLSAFNKKYGSKTEDTNRNKGLPLILDRAKKNYITGMKIFTNNVILHLEESEKSAILRKNLAGTFYIWKVNDKNIQTWKEKIIS